MGIRQFKPVTSSTRFRSVSDFSDVTRQEPERSLLEPLRRTGGRNNKGHVTTRHQGGGHKRRFRRIDFRRDKFGVPGRVSSIEYDPNRSARIALVTYADGEKRYMIAPLGLQVGANVLAGPEADIRPGNALPIRNIPVGTTIHNIELHQGRGGQLVRAAGSSAQLLGKDGDYASVRMPSGEVRLIRQDNMATIGQVGNTDHGNIKIGKAGRKRWMGWRPTVRGSAMDPNSHPHGGGEGRTGIGMVNPKTPWGKPALGKKTRVNKSTDKYIVRRRAKKRR